MTLILPLVSLHSFTMEDQCLEDEETYPSDDWGSSSEQLGFLCNGAMEQDIYPVKGRGIKRKDVCDGNSMSDNNFSLCEQRRVILQASFEKLRHLEDPESCLRRSVLINNTLKLLRGQIYSEENPYTFNGMVNSLNFSEEVDPGRKRFCVSTETACKPNNSKHHITEDSGALNPVGSTCEGCSLSQNFTEDLEDDVFEPDLGHGEGTELKCDRESIFGELDSVFHSFICALEG